MERRREESVSGSGGGVGIVLRFGSMDDMNVEEGSIDLLDGQQIMH